MGKKKKYGYGGSRSFEDFMHKNAEKLFAMGFPGVVFDRHEDFGYFLEHAEHPDAVWSAEELETQKLAAMTSWALSFKRHDSLAAGFYDRLLKVLQSRGVAFTHRSEAELEADFLGGMRSKTLPFVVDDAVTDSEGNACTVVDFSVDKGMVSFVVKEGEKEWSLLPDALTLASS